MNTKPEHSMQKPILFHDIDGVLFGDYDGHFQLRPSVKTWLKWSHSNFEVVWLTAWDRAEIRMLLSILYCEKMMNTLQPPPGIKVADWTAYRSKVEWLAQAVPKLQGREWWWIDDEVGLYQREIASLKLPKDRCIEVSKRGAEALTELREGLERLRYEEVAKVLTKSY